MPRNRLAALALTLLLAGPASAVQQFTAVQELRLTPASPLGFKHFGMGVAIDGDTALVGGFQNAEGRVQVYVRACTDWAPQGVLVPPTAAPNGESFGGVLDLDGDVAVVGRHFEGSAFVFRRTGTVWSVEQELVTSSGAFDGFGSAVAVEGDTIVVGAPLFGFFGKGRAFVFERIGGTWNQVQDLRASDGNAFEEFGDAVALEGSTLVVGSSHSHNGGPVRGTSYLFERVGGTWIEQHELYDSTKYLGISSMSEGRLLLGNRWIYERNGSVWSETASLVPASGESVYDAVLDGDVAVLGLPFYDGAGPGSGTCESGAVSIFTFDGAAWLERDQVSATDAECEDRFGVRVALDGATALVGAPQHLAPTSNAGKAYALELGPGAPVSYCTAGTSAGGCVAVVQAAGTASVESAAGFVLSATGAEGAVPGLFFMGVGGRQAAAWGNGTSYQCVRPPVRRLGLLAGGGGAGTCGGTFVQDLNSLWCPACPKPHLNAGLGTTVQVQLWYSDPASTSNRTSSLSNAIEFAVGF